MCNVRVQSVRSKHNPYTPMEKPWTPSHEETWLNVIHKERIQMASYLALESIRQDALATVRLWIRCGPLLAYSVHKNSS